MILPKIKPYLILKKNVAELMLKELETVQAIRDREVRELALLQMDAKFREECLKTPGNKCQAIRKSDVLRNKLLNHRRTERLENLYQ